MTFLAPLWGGVAVLSRRSVRLRSISSRRNGRQWSPFPTARFVLAGEAQAAARTARPADLVLLALRIATVMLLGAALRAPCGGSAWLRS